MYLIVKINYYLICFYFILNDINNKALNYDQEKKTFNFTKH